MITLRRAAARSGPFVLVAKNQTPLVQIIRGYFDRHSITGEGFNPVLFHPAGGVGHDLMSGIELNTIAGVGQYLGHEAVKLQEFFLRHVAILLDDLSNAVSVEPLRVPLARRDA